MNNVYWPHGADNVFKINHYFLFMGMDYEATGDLSDPSTAIITGNDLFKICNADELLVKLEVCCSTDEMREAVSSCTKKDWQ